jgi:hypothetical protein
MIVHELIDTDPAPEPCVECGGVNFTPVLDGDGNQIIAYPDECTDCGLIVGRCRYCNEWQNEHTRSENSKGTQ